MCGLAGWLFITGTEPDNAVLERMASAIRHRGPDDRGFFRDSAKGIALAHLRLSIIDLSNASHQPMLEPSADTTLVYNGELYNFHKLRSELQSLGHVFVSQGDTEVVLKSYLQWGVECFSRFAGMFAIALWDGRTETLHLARDPMGMKPLYYTKHQGGFAFASEIKAFAELPGFKLRPSDLGLQQYLEFGYVFDQDQTFLEGINKLAPGHRMEVRVGDIERVASYFSPPAIDPNDMRSEKERVDELRDVLTQVVSEHLIADVPVGLLLSGGLDSSVIAALAAKQGPLLTISMGFSDSIIDERPHAKKVSDCIGSRHLEILITPEQVMLEVESGAWVFDDLFADWGTMTTRLMYRRCSEHGIKVVLVGEGADELFGGYEIFNVPESLNVWQQFRLYQRYAGRRHGNLFGDFRKIMSGYLEAGNGDAFHAVRLFESRCQMPNQYVMKVDKASMAESIEARAPYLDRRVAELAYRTPRDWLLRNGESKYLLRAMARREELLPDNISQRIKFGAPLAASWMDDNPAFRAFARERILEGRWCQPLGLEPAMHSYFDQGRKGYGFPRAISIFSNLAWRLLLLELWSQHYLENRAQ